MSTEKNLEGLGGWLILVGLGLIIGPLRMLYEYVPLYVGLFDDGTFALLSTPGTADYTAYFAPLIYAEIALNTALVCAWLTAGVLFFTRRQLFPRLYIGILLFTPLFIVADAFAFLLVAPDEPVFDPATSLELMRAVIPALIWVPYMLVSKRVRATFVR